MIIVLGSYDEDAGVKLVDGGIDTDTSTAVVLPPEEFSQFVKKNCLFHPKLEEFVVRDSLTKQDYEGLTAEV